MSLAKCPECGGQVSTDAPNCPHCGYTPPSQQEGADTANQREKNKGGIPIVGVVVLVVLVGAGVALTMYERKAAEMLVVPFVEVEEAEDG